MRAMKLAFAWLAIASTLALGGCGALVPFGVGAAVGTVVSNQHNKPPQPIPPRPLY